MPNGDERNWGRLCHAIEGFRAAHGTWLTCVRISKICLDNLREDLFTPQSFVKIEERIQFVVDGSAFVAEDEIGRQYSYGDQGVSEHRPDISAESWLGVSIDRPQDDPWEHLR